MKGLSLYYGDLQKFLNPGRRPDALAYPKQVKRFFAYLLTFFEGAYRKTKTLLYRMGLKGRGRLVNSFSYCLIKMRQGFRHPSLLSWFVLLFKPRELKGRLTQEVRFLIANIWKSIFRHPFPANEKEQVRVILNNFFLHLHPPRVKRHGLKITYTFGLGGLSLLLFIIETVTGGFLMLYYIPSIERAYSSYQDMIFTASFARLMQNLHHWAGHGMIVAVFFHMCRVFYTGAYKKPREFNWAIGVFLFVCTLALSYTGYLLPWDQLAFWAITVGSEIAEAAPLVGKQVRFTLLGENIVGQGALIRFYVLHVFILPLVGGALIAIHFWRIRKDGGISGSSSTETEAETMEGNPLPKKGEEKREEAVPSFPHLVKRELTLAVAASAAFLIVSYFLDAPLEELANPNKVPNPAKAPWYFTGLQEMVSWGAPAIGGVILPALIILSLILLPYLDRDPRGTGIWFARERDPVVFMFTAVFGYLIIVTIIGSMFRGENWSFKLPW